MKKIIFILTILILCKGSVFALEKEHSKILQSLNLSQKQIDKIEEIENNYRAKIGKLNAEILLMKMEIAQINPKKGVTDKILILNSKIAKVNSELSEVKEEKKDEIFSVLGFIQKIKFKKALKQSA